MSTALAMAAVTHVLKDLLNDGLINHDVSDLLGTKIKVTAKPPLRESHTPTGDSQLNLFLYQIQPNAAWRNVALPSRNGNGDRLSRPPLALDLYYLLTAYDEADLHEEILLGYGMQLLHETPMLARNAIRTSLTDVTDTPGSLPENLRALTKSGLADQFEAIKITPHYLSVEEMSKLWTGFQAPYRPSMAYLITVVLIESTGPSRAVLPVLTIGPGDSGPVAQANLLPSVPTLLAVRAPNYQPAARSTDTIYLLGHHLDGTASVVLRHLRLNFELILTPGAIEAPPTKDQLGTGKYTFELSDELLQQASQLVPVKLSQSSANLAAGLYQLELRVQPTAQTIRTSNALSLILAPDIVVGAGEPHIQAPASTTAFRQTKITLKCRPAVHKGQSVSLVIGDRELTGEPQFANPTDPTDTIIFNGNLPAAMFVPIGNPPSTKKPIRLRVDGVESLLIKYFKPNKPPEFDPSQVIPLP